MAKLISIADARTMDLPGRRSREIVGAMAGAANSTIRLVEIDAEKPGARPRGPHVHREFEECIHVLAGEGVTRTESGEYRLSAGDTIIIPPGERHATYNTGSSVLQLLCFFPVNDIRPGTEEFASWESDRA